ncbi:T9SS type A sorting domain-containing protein [Polaribacter sp.]|uniref:T9SS type A sorting domain-containing protein n=1 Tax=Polaribacter sp. TaxID=1920175 RepID=UPI004048DCC7
MKKNYFFLLFISLSTLSFGQILSDDFNYSDSALLTDNGWTSFNGGTTEAIDVGASNGLTYLGYSGLTGFTAVAEGNAVRLDANGQDVQKTFTPITTGTIYYSFLINIDAANAATGYCLGLTTTGTTFGNRFFVKPSSNSGKVNFGLSNTSTANYSTTDFDTNTTYLIIIKYDVNSSGSYSMWVKSSGVPTSEIEAGTPDLTNSGSGSANIGGFFFRQHTASQNLTIDGLRIYNTWFGATPCDLTLDAETTSCDVSTLGLDNYTVTIPFTGGNTATYSLSTTNGTISGDNPSTTAEGNIIITGVAEGTNITLTVTGGCAISKTISAPECKPINTLPFYEGFDYTVGNSLGLEQKWTNVNTGDDIIVSTGSLSYTGLTNMGNSISFDGSGIDTFSPITSISEGTIYYSFLLNVGSMVGVTDTNGGYLAGFAESTTTLGATLWTKRVDDTNFNLGIEVRTANATNTTFIDTSFQTGQTYFVVIGYTFNTDTTSDDIVSLWVNPVLNSTQPTATVTDTHAATDLASISTFFLRQDSASETPSVQIDELRIATSWSDVVPSNNTASVKNNNIEGFATYPNPVTSDNFTITSNSGDKKEVTIFNVLGKKVLSTSFSGTKADINVAAISSGIYILKVSEGEKAAISKLIIK